MLDGMFIASIIDSVVKIFKEKNTKVIPAENWANERLYYEDMMNGVSHEQLMKNVRNGRYKVNEQEDIGKYGKPRYFMGKVIVEDEDKYWRDAELYGMPKACQWAEMGKYNLPPEEKE